MRPMPLGANEMRLLDRRDKPTQLSGGAGQEEQIGASRQTRGGQAENTRDRLIKHMKGRSQEERGSQAELLGWAH